MTPIAHPGSNRIQWVVLLCLVGMLAGQTGRPGTVQVEREVYLMGTDCSLSSRAADRPAGLRRLEEVLRVLEQTEDELSTWRSDSALSLLNRQPLGESFTLQPGLCELFQDLFRWNRRTRGTFDPGIGALVQAWGLRSGGRLPGAEDLAEALSRSGIRNLRLDARSCSIVRLQDVVLDAGGFGKGEALDRAFQYSRQHSLGSWTADLGGQVGVWLTPDEVPIEIDVAHPQQRREAALRVRLKAGSLSVSGGSERDRQVDGQRVGHILDPRTGRPAPFAGSVAVWHSSALAADILSTALYVLGPQEGLTWAEAEGIAVCYLTAGDAEASPVEARCSSGFRPMLAHPRQSEDDAP